MNIKPLILSAVLVLLAFPFVSSAHTPDLLSGGYWGKPLVSCSAPLELNSSGEPVASGNPCTNLCDLVHTFVHLTVFAMSITLYVLAPILFSWGGILILVAGANPGLIDRARKILIGTVIGVVITLSAFLIVKTLVTTLDITEDLFGFGFSSCSLFFYKS